MKVHFYFLLVAFSFSLHSCIEIIDDVSLNSDGSGTLKYTINLSASKVKINSILALDSLDGRRIPSMDEIKSRVARFQASLEAKPGISNVSIESNYTDFFFRLTCDFQSLDQLQNALSETIKEESEEKNIPELDHKWLSWDGNKLTRSIPEITLQKTKSLKQEDLELLKQGNYTCISRFSRLVDRFDNSQAVLSKNKMAVMVKTNAYSLTQNPNLLENTIYLLPGRN
jgi:hypothetical protein